MIKVTAPAKIILFGEHAVVYGHPAIAVPITSLNALAQFTPAKHNGLQIDAADLNERYKVVPDNHDNALTFAASETLRQLEKPTPSGTIHVTSTIPIASGMGSGTAIATVIARAAAQAVGVELGKDQLNTIIYRAEKINHGTPSGIDNSVIVYESPVYFVQGEPIEYLKIKQPLHLVIADTGVKAPTKVTVGDVRILRETQPKTILPILEEIGTITMQARQAIDDGSTDRLGDLMKKNHKLLQQLTVSSNELDTLVEAALLAGAMGAKLSGGGRGGNMIAVVDSNTIGQVITALEDAGARQVFSTVVP